MGSLADELTSINSIYAEDTLQPLPITAPNNTFSLCILRPPTLAAVAVRVEFPAEYPDVPPAILGTESVGDELPKGFGRQVVEILRDTLARIYRPGEPCIFDLLEETGETLEQAKADHYHSHHHNQDINQEQHEHEHEHEQSRDNESQTRHVGDGRDSEGAAAQQSSLLQGHDPPPWSLSQPLTVHKSVFVARVASVTSPALARSYLAHLIASDKGVAKATHNITAWRIRGDGGTTYQDCYDDGETAAGRRVLHLMQVMDVWDVMVVVTRWYGGVLLGPERFRCINQVAREALIEGKFFKGEKEGAGKKKGKK
jgi:hypothetical protein